MASFHFGIHWHYYS